LVDSPAKNSDSMSNSVYSPFPTIPLWSFLYSYPYIFSSACSSLFYSPSFGLIDYRGVWFLDKANNRTPLVKDSRKVPLRAWEKRLYIYLWLEWDLNSRSSHSSTHVFAINFCSVIEKFNITLESYRWHWYTYGHCPFQWPKFSLYRRCTSDRFYAASYECEVQYRFSRTEI
jgi:hypothetical protein